MSSPAPLCPRCGYDQQGIVDTWADTCPTRGLCSECGLDFQWADVLNPFRGRLRGLVEHSRGARQWLGWTLVTFSWIVLPHRFWNRVQVHHTVRLRRILLAPLVTGVIAQAAAGISGFLSLLVNGSSWGPPVRWDNIGEWYPNALSPFLQPFASTYAWSVSGVTTHQFQSMVELWIVRFVAVAACILMWPILFAILPSTRRLSRLRWAHIWRAGLYPFWWLVFILILDRSVSIGVDFLSVSSALVGPELTAAVGRAADPFVQLLAEGVWVIAPLWVGSWWYFAIVRGWKLHRARLLWFLLMLAGSAATALAALAVWYARVLADPLTA